MKKLLIALLSMSMLSAVAQDNDVSVTLTNLLIAKPTVGYERGFSDGKISLQGNLGLFIPRQVEQFDTYVAAEDGETTEGTAELSSKFGGFTFVPEFRVYPSGDMRGFYFGPYLKYAYRKMQFEGNFTDVTDGTEYDGKLIGNINSMGVGFQLGSQWIISDVVSIDFYWMSLGLSRNMFKLRAESSDSDVDFQGWEDDLNADIGEAPILGGKITTESGEDFAEVKFESGIAVEITRIPCRVLRDISGKAVDSYSESFLWAKYRNFTGVVENIPVVGGAVACCSKTSKSRIIKTKE